MARKSQETHVIEYGSPEHAAQAARAFNASAGLAAKAEVDGSQVMVTMPPLLVP